ncbi:MAG: polyprenyl synthetase family protein [Bacteroidales bacterium]|nr:polyprenyl synthetase family protein [Bacteroidales bacterium]
MDIKAIQEYLGEDWLSVKNTILKALQSDIDLLNSTNGSILSHSGKQMRPMLALLMAKACSGGKVSADTIRFASASELLHNATLLHDDVADKSDRRRGVPTIMSLMGPSVSVLVGDYWLVKAMELILDADADDTRVIRIFSRTLSDLAEGEMLQLQKAHSGDTDEDAYLRIIYNKTASLFEAACVSAVISVGGSVEQMKAAKDYAVALGNAFQIQDDILDYTGTDVVGKPLGADVLEQKITLPLLGALTNVGRRKAEEIYAMIREIPAHPEYRDDIMAFVRNNGGIGYAESRLAAYVEEAIAALDGFEDSQAKSYLVEMAYFTVKRAM